MLKFRSVLMVCRVLYIVIEYATDHEFSLGEYGMIHSSEVRAETWYRMLMFSNTKKE
jgi:hypothetical protein